MSDEPKTKEQWYVTTDFLHSGGKVVKTQYGQLLGPWPTQAEAMACRFGFEQGTGSEGRYFVDQATA